MSPQYRFQSSPIQRPSGSGLSLTSNDNTLPSDIERARPDVWRSSTTSRMPPRSSLCTSSTFTFTQQPLWSCVLVLCRRTHHLDQIFLSKRGLTSTAPQVSSILPRIPLSAEHGMGPLAPLEAVATRLPDQLALGQLRQIPVFPRLPTLCALLKTSKCRPR